MPSMTIALIIAGVLLAPALPQGGAGQPIRNFLTVATDGSVESADAGRTPPDENGWRVGRPVGNQLPTTVFWVSSVTGRIRPEMPRIGVGESSDCTFCRKFSTRL